MVALLFSVFVMLGPLAICAFVVTPNLGEHNEACAVVPLDVNRYLSAGNRLSAVGPHT
jgi:hypothetical protein